MGSVAKKRATGKKAAGKPVSAGIRRAAKRAGIESSSELDPHAAFVASLAMHAAEALGVNGNSPTAEHILEHSIGQACLELETVENALEPMLERRHDEGHLLYVLQGIRKRLELAANSAPFLAKVISHAQETRFAAGGAS